MNGTSSQKFSDECRRFVVVVLAFACVTGVYPAVAEDVVYGYAAGIGGFGEGVGWGIAVDGMGSVYTTGIIGGVIDFDPCLGTATLTGLGFADFFVQKLSASGNLAWAQSTGGIRDGFSVGIALDDSGNIYIGGWFNYTIDFDPGPGTFNLTSAGESDIFVSKLDPAGNFLWARAMGGPERDQALDIAVDWSGNVYTTGQFEGTSDFDPGEETTELTSRGRWSIFVSKLDANGNFVWARNLSGSTTAWAEGIAVDGLGNVHITGTLTDRAVIPYEPDFDPGPGTAPLHSAGGEDIFVVKLDANGDFVWAKAMGGSFGDWGKDITVDGAGNVYTTGGFADTADFDPGEGIATLTTARGSQPAVSDIFVSKFDSDGNFVWVKGMGSSDAHDGGWGIALDGAGNVFTTGRFRGTVDFDPGEGTFELSSPYEHAVFVYKLNSRGDFVWAKAFSGSDNDGEAIAGDIAVDASSNVYTTGTFWGLVDFDPSPSTINLSGSDNQNMFVSKLVSVTGPGGVITSNQAPDLVEEGSTWVLTAPDGSGHSWTWPGKCVGPAENVSVDGATLTVSNISEVNLGTYRVVYDGGSKGIGRVFSEIVVSALAEPAPEPDPTPRKSGGGGGNCFIATAAYGTPLAEEVEVLRGVRDGYLLNGVLGTAFVDAYYRVSPPVADVVGGSEGLRGVVRVLLGPVVLFSRVLLGAPGLVMLIGTIVFALGLRIAAKAMHLRALWARRRI